MCGLQGTCQHSLRTVGHAAQRMTPSPTSPLAMPRRTWYGVPRSARLRPTALPMCDAAWSASRSAMPDSGWVWGVAHGLCVGGTRMLPASRGQLQYRCVQHETGRNQAHMTPHPPLPAGGTAAGLRCPRSGPPAPPASAAACRCGLTSCWRWEGATQRSAAQHNTPARAPHELLLARVDDAPQVVAPQLGLAADRPQRGEHRVRGRRRAA